MTQGWRTPLTEEAMAFPNEVVAVIVDRGFPEMELVTDTLRRAPEGTVVVIKYADKRDLPTLQAVQAAGIEPVFSRPNPYWKGVAAHQREAEFLGTCSRVLVFKNRASDAQSYFAGLLEDWAYASIYQGRLFVVEKGKKKIKQRKGRKVE